MLDRLAASIPDSEQLLVEALAFSVPGIARAGIAAGAEAKKHNIKEPEKTTPDNVEPKYKTEMTGVAESDLLKKIALQHGKKNPKINAALEYFKDYGMETKVVFSKKQGLSDVIEKAKSLYGEDKDVKQLLEQLDFHRHKPSGDDPMKGAFINRAKKYIQNNHPKLIPETENYINAAINKGYIDFLKRLARPQAEKYLDKMQQTIDTFKLSGFRRKTAPASYAMYGKYGTAQNALMDITNDVTRLRGIAVPDLDSGNVSKQTMALRKEAASIMAPWPEFKSETGEIVSWEPEASEGKLPHVDPGKLKGGHTKQTTRFLGQSYMRRPLTGMRKSPLLTEAVKWYADTLIEDGLTELSLKERDKYRQIKEDFIEKGGYDFWPVIYRQMPHIRDKIAEIWEEASFGVHDVLSKRQMKFEGKVSSNIDSYIQWEDFEKQLKNAKAEKFGMPVISDKYDKSGLKLEIPKKFESQLKAMDKFELFNRHSIVQFDYTTPDEKLIQDPQRAKLDLGEKAYEDGIKKGKKTRIVSSVEPDSSSGRFRITIYNPESTKSGALAHERGHIRLRVIRQTMPELRHHERDKIEKTLFLWH